MGTPKLTAIWRIIRAKHVILFTKGEEYGVTSMGFGQGDLKDIILLTVEIQNSYNSLIQLVREAAADKGELHTITELRNAIEELENGRK